MPQAAPERPITTGTGALALCHPSVARVKVCSVALVEFQSGVVTSTSWRASDGSTCGCTFAVDNDVAAVAISSAQPGHARHAARLPAKSRCIILAASSCGYQGLSMFWMRS
jgi:hypothetical protein